MSNAAVRPGQHRRRRMPPPPGRADSACSRHGRRIRGLCGSIHHSGSINGPPFPNYPSIHPSTNPIPERFKPNQAQSRCIRKDRAVSIPKRPSDPVNRRRSLPNTPRLHHSIPIYGVPCSRRGRAGSDPIACRLIAGFLRRIIQSYVLWCLSSELNCGSCGTNRLV
jgi:hypothetical protein